MCVRLSPRIFLYVLIHFVFLDWEERLLIKYFYSKKKKTLKWLNLVLKLNFCPSTHGFVTASMSTPLCSSCLSTHLLQTAAYDFLGAYCDPFSMALT